MYNICVHLKSILSGLIPDDALKREIGYLVTTSDQTFLDLCHDYNVVASHLLQDVPLNGDETKFIKMQKFSIRDDRPLTGNAQPGVVRPFLQMVTNSEILNAISSLAPSPRRDKALASVMKLKTGRSIPGPSRAQIGDIYSSITDMPKIEHKQLNLVQTEIPLFIKRFLDSRQFLYELPREYTTLVGICANPDKMSLAEYTDEDGINHIRRMKRNQLVNYNSNLILRDPRVNSIITQDPDSIISSCYVGTEVRNGKFHITDLLDRELPVGYISVINEPGGKLRVVANPCLWYYCASSPLGSFMRNCNSSWSVQGVDSHEETVKFLSKKLASFKGKRRFYSVDMKNFTDRLPYDPVQRIILTELEKEGLIRSSDLAIMDIICHGEYQFQRTTVRYGAGTPQGTAPSFPLCSFTNGMVAAIAYKLSHHKDWTEINLNRLPFRIIGDDIVLWDDLTADTYKYLMTGLGVVVSQDKCMTSTHYCEMCSKIISAEGIYPQKKIMRREDKTYTPLQTVASRIEYYSDFPDETILQTFIEESELPADLVSLIQTVPKPYGLGPQLDEIMTNVVKGVPVDTVQLLTLTEHLRSALADSHSLRLGDVQAIFDRTDLYPSMDYEVVGDESDVVFHKESSKKPIFHSLERDFKDLSAMLYKALATNSALPDTSRESVASAINRVNSLTGSPREDLLIKKEAPASLTTSRTHPNLLDRCANIIGVNAPDGIPSEHSSKEVHRHETQVHER